MTDDLIKRLRSQKAVDGRPHEIEQLTDEAAAMIEQQADQLLGARRTAEYWKAEHNAANKRIAELEAQLAAVAPAVDAQPVAWALRIGDSDMWSYTHAESDADFYGEQSGLKYEKRPLYDTPQSEGLRKDAIRREALEEAAKLCDEKAVDYERDFEPARSIAAERCADSIRALSNKDPQ